MFLTVSVFILSQSDSEIKRFQSKSFSINHFRMNAHKKVNDFVHCAHNLNHCLSENTFRQPLSFLILFFFA